MDADEEDERPYDYMAPEIVEAREEVGRAVANYLNIMRPEETPYVVAWVVGAEWTNTELEQTGRAGRDVISPSEQTISGSAGLGAYIAARFA
jgi:hypothetical protein